MLTNQNVHVIQTPNQPYTCQNNEGKNIYIYIYIFNGVWICSLKQKFKGTIKLNITIRIRVLHICIGLKH